MRRTAFRIFVATLFIGAIPAILNAAGPDFELKVGSRLSGAPLSFDVEATGWPEGVAPTVRASLDGQLLGEQHLESGKASFHFPELSLNAGAHELVIEGGGGRASERFRLIPGWMSILPPLIAIGLALVARDVLISLFLGIFGGALILNHWNPFAAFGRTVDQFIVPALADSDHISIVVFTLFLGGMVGLITKSGGTQGIVELLAPYATNRLRGQVATWLMGILIFFDDYANTLIVGSTMRPITDRLRISREKLAYIVDSTAAPVVCLFPITTWVGFEIGLIDSAFEQLGLPFDAYTTFLHSIPFRFYPPLALVMVLTIGLSGRDLGPMARAEKRATERGEVLAPGAVPIADYASDALEPPEDAPRRALNAFVPIFTVILITLMGLYLSGASGLERAPGTGSGAWLREVFSNANSFHALLWASFSGMLVALVLPVVQRLLKLGEAMGAMIEGFKAMLMALVVLTLAWSIGSVCAELQTAEYLVSLVSGVVAPMWLSALTFLLSAAVAFATGSSWGTMAILEPLVIPICHSLSTSAGFEVGGPQYMTYMLGTIASVLAGSVWGDHCSPISDTTILSSMATGCDHIAHVRTQIPYALIAGGLGLFLGNIGTAVLGISPWIALLVGSATVVTIVRFFGRRVVA